MWGKEEDDYLREWYGIIPTIYLAQVLDKPYKSVMAYAKRQRLDGEANLRRYIGRESWKLHPRTLVKPYCTRR